MRRRRDTRARSVGHGPQHFLRVFADARRWTLQALLVSLQVVRVAELGHWSNSWDLDCRDDPVVNDLRMQHSESRASPTCCMRMCPVAMLILQRAA